MILNNLTALLIKSGNISDKYEDIAKYSGENFNIFKILNLQTAEVRTHSALIAEMLSPFGSHGQKDLFLKLFVKQFSIHDFDTQSATVEIEKFTGIIDSEYTKGGRIDIVLTDQYDKRIIIENKIYAGDQKNQLLRYYNFDKNAHLFYLTLFGDYPSEYSTDNKLTSDNYRVLSYTVDIINWLENCKKEAVSLPVIRESLAQYISLIRFLTNQTSTEKMKQEIISLLQKNPDYIDAFETCSQAVNEMVMETKAKFVSLFNHLFPTVDLPLTENTSLNIRWGEDGDGIYFGYQYHESGINQSSSEKGRALNILLKETEAPSKVYSNSNYIGWFFANPIQPKQKFEHLDKKIILKMSTDESFMRGFIDSLIAQEAVTRSAFFKRIEHIYGKINTQLNPLTENNLPS